MKSLGTLLEFLMLICVFPIHGREIKPIDLFNPLRSLELNTLEEESLKLEIPQIVPASHTGVDVTSKRDLNLTDFGDGYLCMEKVMTIAEIVYDEEVRCNHVTYENCYQAYKTIYKPQPTETCQENFKQECSIEYEEVAKTEIIHVCSMKAERNCSVTGNETCTTIYETVCESKQRTYNISNDVANCRIEQEKVCWTDLNKPEECRNVTTTKCDLSQKNETKGFPETQCLKIPRDVCGPEKCPIVTYELCEDKEKTFVTSVPKEHCEMKPFTICTTEIVSLPSLEQVNECVQVPKEVCALEKVNPRQIVKPVVRKWCIRKDDNSTGNVTSSSSSSGSSTSTGSTSGTPELRSELEPVLVNSEYPNEPFNLANLYKYEEEVGNAVTYNNPQLVH